MQLKWRYISSRPMCGWWIRLGMTVSCTSGIPSLGIYRNLGVSFLNLNKSWSCWDTTSLQGLFCLLSSTLRHIQEQLNSVSWFTPLTQFMRDSRISSWPFVLKPNVLNATHQLRKRGAFYPSTVLFSVLQESYSALKCTINVTVSHFPRLTNDRRTSNTGWFIQTFRCSVTLSKFQLFNDAVSGLCSIECDRVVS